TDSFQPVFVEHGQFSAERIGAFVPELVVDSISVVTEVHLILAGVERRGRTVHLGQGEGVSHRAGGQATHTGPVVVVGRQSERHFLRRDSLQGEVERLPYPGNPGDRAGRGDAVVVVVGAQ